MADILNPRIRRLKALERWLPALLLTICLSALATASTLASSTLLRVLLGLSTIGLLGMWWLFRRAEGELRSVLPEFHAVRQEALALRPILRFTFETMSDKNVQYGEAQACRLRHDLLGPLNVASGFLELLASEMSDRKGSLAAEYLQRARDGVARAIELAMAIGTVSGTDEDAGAVPSYETQPGAGLVKDGTS